MNSNTTKKIDMRKKSIVRLLTYIIAVVIGSFTSLSVQAKDCDYEIKFFPYMTSNGASTATLDTLGNTLDGIAAKVLEKVIYDAIGNASGILKLSEAMKTDKVFRNVHIIYLYRFTHQKKLIGSWQIAQKNNIMRNGVDYHQAKDIPGVIREGKQQIRRQLEKQLKEDCKNHQ
ncbi:hypothetical protein [Akkermansia sp.]|uniref:hypothetical protein n=1 Tax=Akkermansia sp. TaxID=1872421 RepID=UPI0025BEB5BB|nr:hypothetical protein [Akkermansia sp.]